ncbi:MAG: glycosyltransferase family 2 protein, partial [Oscillospiraceae bacterium]|nr:glycosyltransferase family 2 protein [Oscillospiraceae bacterium]
EYLALLDHDDVLAPHAVYEMSKAIAAGGAAFLYSDEALFKKDIRRPLVGHFKPDYSESYLLSCNYICHLAVFKKELFEKAGGFDSACAGSQDHDLFLRLIEAGGPPVHLPKVLYYWRVHEASTSGGTGAKPYVTAAAIRAIEGHLRRTGAKAAVSEGLFPSTYRVKYQLEKKPLVSVLIPNMDHTGDLEKALSSIYEKTSYRPFEILIAENNSQLPETFAYYEKLPQKYPEARVIYYQGAFNYSAINNFARREAKGEYLLLLNNDVEVISSGWLEEMVGRCSQPGVGAVGAMLYYPDDTVQHAGIITGLGGYAGHNQKYQKRGKSGYMFRLAAAQELSAVTGACMLVRTEAYDEVSGLDEGFTVAYNDVDFCLRLRRAGWRVIFTPYAELYHYESKSRGLDEKDKAKKERFAAEQRRLYNRFGDSLKKDPFYNPNLTLDSEDFAENPVLDRG